MVLTENEKWAIGAATALIAALAPFFARRKVTQSQKQTFSGGSGSQEQSQSTEE